MGQRPLDEAECMRVAASLRASVTHYGLTLHPAADLSRMIEIAERAHHGGVLATQDHEQVRLLGQAQHVAKVLEWFRTVDDKDRVVAWLKKSLDRIGKPASDGLDRLYEIEIAGRLAKSGLFSVSTGEPDIVIEFPATNVPGGTFTVACKHPDTERGVSACIEKGGKQIAGQSHPGIVMVGLDSVVHQAGRWLKVADPPEAAQWAADQATKIGQGTGRKSVGRAFREERTVAVVFDLSVPYFTEGPPRSGGFHRGVHWITNPSVPSAGMLLPKLVQILFDT